MATRFSDYAQLITSKKIHFVPTCLILEIMASVFGYVVRVPINRQSLEEDRPRILEVIEIFYNDVACTLEAYRSEQMRFFSGDWKTDRLKAQRIFIAFMARLKKLHYFFWGPYQVQLKEYMTRLEKIWGELYALLDERCGPGHREKSSGTTRYFHSSDAETWQKTMANIIANLHSETEREEEDFLLLICCSKVKMRLIAKIDFMQAKRGISAAFDGDCILSVSQQEPGMTCPLCMRFSDELLLRSCDSARLEAAGSTPAFPLHPAYQEAATRDTSEFPAVDIAPPA